MVLWQLYLGILLFSGPMLKALDLWEKPMRFLFMGAIIASIPPLYRKVRVSKIKPVNIGVAALGTAFGVMTMYLPEGIFGLSEQFDFKSFLMLILAGFVIAIALVLPGISASYILLMLGMYNITLIAIKEMNLLYLMPLAFGIIGGTFLTAGLLEREMQKHPQFTYMLIIGFMLGSLVEVFPGIPLGLESVSCLITFASGFGVILWLGRRRE